MNRGFMYLVAVMDWYSRKVLSYRLSNTMEADFCVEAVAEAIKRYGRPEIFNTDQGAQFTSEAFAGLLKRHNIAISMDGRRRMQDNIFIERLWWTLKHHYIYLHSFDTGSELRYGLRNWFKFYNKERFHQALDNLTPDEIYYGLPHPFAEGNLIPSSMNRLRAYLPLQAVQPSGSTANHSFKIKFWLLTCKRCKFTSRQSLPIRYCHKLLNYQNCFVQR